MPDNTLQATVLARLDTDPKSDRERDLLVLAALDGPDALQGYLDGHTAPQRPDAPSPSAAHQPAREPLGAYLKSITVEGSRGVGERRTLDLPPGPGLTLVVGRNGSGKSSFAAALELILTGDTFRMTTRRSRLPCELDAAFFLLYALSRAEVEHVLGTFPLVQRTDEASLGEYRTRRLILEQYDLLSSSSVRPAVAEPRQAG